MRLARNHYEGLQCAGTTEDLKYYSDVITLVLEHQNITAIDSPEAVFPRVQSVRL